MAMHSRSRATRDSSTRATNTTASSTRTRAQQDASEEQSQHHQSQHARDHHEHAPPSKRRKLSIRSKQTTLDGHFSLTSSAPPPPKPPTRVTLAQPHGRLLQNLNGVQIELDANEDDLSSLPVSGAATPPPAAKPPKPAPLKKEDKRTLRSQDDGPRLKSELAVYFPNYEDIIFDAPRDIEFLTVDSSLYVTEDAAPKSEQTTPVKSSKNSKPSPSHTRNASSNSLQHSTTPRRPSTNQFNGSPILNLEIIARGLPQYPEDPLVDDYYLKSHRRAERKEKQLRNIEKERAMHEKVQLDRLLEGLQGHDWLKVLGITGITDGEAKKYEPKRDYFIAEVKALVDKFKEWKEEERRQKMERDAMIAAREEESEEPESGESSVGPPSSDLNASAARQLQQETASALKSLALHKAARAADASNVSPSKPPPTIPAPPVQEEPITSFYDKRHLRDAALGKARHGRSVTAFGQPVPDLEEREFELPADYASEDAIRANAREKRRRKRETVTNASN